jgi:hypothetical protein
VEKAVPETRPDPDAGDGAREGDEGGTDPEEGDAGDPAGAPAPGAEAPRPAALLLKDGSVVEGFVVARSPGVYWIVSAEARAIPEDDVSEAIGNTDPASGGITFSGDVLRDARKMLDELGSGDSMRTTIAATVLDRYGAEAAPVLIDGLKHPKGSVRRQCIALLQTYKVAKAVQPVLDVLRGDVDPAIRTAAAQSLFEWNSAEVRRALMDASWRDRSDDVKVAALNTLARCATAEEASALMDLLAIFDAGSRTGKAVVAALQQATGQRLVDDPEIWRNWWHEGGGRELIAARVDNINEERRRESERAYERLMRSAFEEEGPPVPTEDSR